MGDPNAASDSTVRPLRVWPVVGLAAVYWAFIFAIFQLDMAMFTRFMSKSLAGLAFLVLFIVLWLSSGKIPWQTRLIGLATFIVAVVLGIKLADRTLDPFSFVLIVVPYVLTAWAGWMVVCRRSPATQTTSLIAGLLATALLFDLVRWDGTDARLHSTLSFRWSATAEQKFLAAKIPTAAPRETRAWTLRSGDWPEFRGPRRDGAVRGVRIDPNWKSAPPEKLWRMDVGPGWSSMILVDGFLVTQEQRGENEAVVCYAADTGSEVWAYQGGGRFSEGIAGAGPRATPTYRDGRIYSYGANGHLSCLEAATGKLLWSREAAREGGAALPQWGYSASPLVADGKVIVYVGEPRGVVAVEAATGAPAWARGAGKFSYSSAHLVTIGGVSQVVMQDNTHTRSLAAADGAVLWERANTVENAIPMLQPQPGDDSSLLISSGLDLALVEVRRDGSAWKVADKWVTTRFKPSFNDFVVHDGYAFGLDDGILACVDLKDGRRVWKKGRYGGGQILLLADQGLMLVISEKGELALVEAKPQEPGEVDRFPALEGKTWNHPILAGDRIFVRNSGEMACYRVRLIKSP
jgi:outer membrane protein assembly factor BamB